MPDHRLETVRLLDAEIALLRGGTGAPLMFLHDATGSAGWAPALDRLAQHYDVLAPEHPGFGGGEAPPWLDRVSDLANFYLDLLERRDIQGVHLVGASLGGWIAAELATRNTSRLATLTLIDPQGLRVEGGIDAFATNDEQTIRDLFVASAPADAAVKRLLAPDAEDALLRNKMVTAKLAWQPRLHDPHLAKWLHRIDVPSLILWGEGDRILPKAGATQWQKAIPESRVAVVAKAGHLPHLEQPEETARLIHDFIAKHRKVAS